MRVASSRNMGDGGGRGSPRNALTIVAVAAAMVLASVVTASATPVAGFEIDGDLVATSGETDWAPDGGTGIIDATRDADDDGDAFTQDCTQNSLVAGWESAVLICDDVKNDRSTHEGGDKEDDPASWGYIQSNVTPKTDITNVYAAGAFDAGSPILFNALERLPKAGSLNLDFEYNQLTTTNANGFLVPDRTEGDVLVAINLGGKRANDASALNVQVFVAGPGGLYDFDNPDADVSGAGTLAASGITAEISSTTIDCGPWQCFDDGYNLVGTLPAFAFAEVAVDLQEAAGLTNVCLNNVTVRSRASESVTAQLKDTTDIVPFGFCGGLSVEKYIDVDEDGDGGDTSPAGRAPEEGDLSSADDLTGNDDLDGWAFSIYEGGDTTGTLVCSGTTDDGVLGACTNGGETVDLSTLQPGQYTIQEADPGQEWFNTAPGTQTRTRTIAVGVGTNTTVYFGNACFIDLDFSVDSVPSGQSGLFAYYSLNGGATVQVALTNDGGTWTGSADNVAVLGDTVTWGYGINQGQADEQSVEVASGVTVDGGYPDCEEAFSTSFTTATVSGTKYKDVDGDGVFDDGEGAAPAGVAFTFELYAGHDADTSGNPLQTATYDATNDGDGTAPDFGEFLFSDVAPGEYTVVEGTPPTNWVQSDPLSGGYNVTVTLAHAAAESDVTTASDGSTPLRFGNEPLASFEISFNDLTGMTDSTIECVGVVDAEGDYTGGGDETFHSELVEVGTYSCTITIVDP